MGTNGTTYRGIDGGGTRCRVRIEVNNGRLLGEAGLGPATTRIGAEKALRSIMEATEAAAVKAGPARADFARHVAISLAGLGRRGAEAALNKFTHSFTSVIFISNGMAACLGAHSGADGAIGVAGIGVVGVGLIGGREIRLAGYGFPVSDEGSGADIGLHVMRLAVRAADRRRRVHALAFRDAGHIRSRSLSGGRLVGRSTGPRLRCVRAYRDSVRPPRRSDRSYCQARGRRHRRPPRSVPGQRHQATLAGERACNAITPWLTPDLREGLKRGDADAAAGALLTARDRLEVPRREIGDEQAARSRV